MALHFAGHIPVNCNRIFRVALIGVVFARLPREDLLVDPRRHDPAARVRPKLGEHVPQPRRHRDVGERQRERGLGGQALEGASRS